MFTLFNILVVLSSSLSLSDAQGLNGGVSRREDASLIGPRPGGQDAVSLSRTHIDGFNLQNGQFLQRTQSQVVPLSYRSERVSSWSGVSPIQRSRMTRLLVPVKRYFPVYFRVYRLADGRIVRVPIIYRFYQTVPPGTRGAIRSRRGNGFLVPIPVFVLNREGKLVYNPVVYVEFMTMMRRNGFSRSDLMSFQEQFGRDSVRMPQIQGQSFSQGRFAAEGIGGRFGQQMQMGNRNQLISGAFRSGQLNNGGFRQSATNVYIPSVRMQERFSIPQQYPWTLNSQRFNFQTGNTNTINGIPMIHESRPIPSSFDGRSTSGQIFNGNAGIMSTQDNGMAARRQNARIQFRDSGKTMARVGVDQAVDNPSVVGGTIVDPPPQIPPMERTNIGFEDRTNTAKIPSTLSGSVADRSMSGARFGFQDGASLGGQVQGMGSDGGILSSGFASGGPALGGSMIGPDRGMPPRFQDGTPFLQTDPRSSLRPFSGSSLTEAGGTRPFTLPPFVDNSLTPTDRTRPLTLPPFTDNSLTDRVRTGSLPMPSVTSGSPREIGGTRPMTLPQFGGSSLRGTVDISGSPREIGGTRPMHLPQFGGSSLRGTVDTRPLPSSTLTGISSTGVTGGSTFNEGKTSVSIDKPFIDEFAIRTNAMQNTNLPSRDTLLPHKQDSGVIGIVKSDQGSASLPSSVIGVGITDETKLGTPVSIGTEGTFNGKPVSTLEDPITGLPHGFLPTDPVRIGTAPIVDEKKTGSTPDIGAEIVTELIGVPPSLAELLNDHGFLDYLNSVIASGDIVTFKGQPERFLAPLAILETLAKPEVTEYLNYLVAYLNQQQSSSITPPKMPIELETLLNSKLFIDFMAKRKLDGRGPMIFDFGTDIHSTGTKDTATTVAAAKDTAATAIANTKGSSKSDPLFIEGSSGGIDHSMIGDILGLDQSEIHVLPIGEKIPDGASTVAGDNIPILPTIPDTLVKNTEIIPAGVVTEVLPLELCMGCKIDGGLGYTNHPSRCDMFVMCYPGLSGTFIPMAQQCPYGLFWSQASLTCKLSKDVHCPHEVCRNQYDKYQYAHKDHCAAYWECKEGYSEAHCCPEGMAFFDGVGCMASDKCNSPCPPNKNTNEELLWQGACDRRDIPGAPTKYERHIHRNTQRDMFGRTVEEWVEQDCPLGTIFRKEICDCSMAALETPHYEYEGHVCSPEIFMPFTRNLFDNSIQRTHVRADNVTRTGGVACFNGKSALAIPKYANMDLGTYFYATFKYKHDEPTEKTQALLYNGDCNVKPSMVLGSKTDGIFFNMKTTTGEVHTLFAPTNVPPTEWRTASVVVDGSNVVLKTDDFTEKLSFSGGVARSKCGLKIGWGQEYTNFVGCIDEFKLYRCRPEEPSKKRQDIYPEINMMNSG